eukprot:1612380-Rhodomonas_salina.1
MHVQDPDEQHIRQRLPVVEEVQALSLPKVIVGLQDLPQRRAARRDCFHVVTPDAEKDQLHRRLGQLQLFCRRQRRADPDLGSLAVVPDHQRVVFRRAQIQQRLLLPALERGQEQLARPERVVLADAVVRPIEH